MSNEVRYVSMETVLTDKLQESRRWEQEIARIAEDAEQEMKENAGFLKLVYWEEGEVLYYNHKIHGILGNLSDVSSLGAPMPSEILARQLSKKDSLLIYQHLQAKILHKDEYQTLFFDGDYESVRSRRGWLDMKQISVMAADHADILGASRQNPVYLIAVIRCDGNGWEIPSDISVSDLMIRLILRGLRPASYTDMEDFGSLRLYIENYYSNVYQEVKPLTEVIVASSDNLALEEVKEYFCKKDFQAANLPIYDESIFEWQKGSWDLYPFVGVDEEAVRNQGGSWYQVSGLYARDPACDVAPDTAVVAIDFGTKSTTVAVFDEKGNITMIPVGNMAEQKESAFENPTIIKFFDVSQFMSDYRKTEFRPDTKFNDISVSHPVLDEYEGKQADIQMQWYLNHLKQWVNDSNSILEAIDSKGKQIQLGHSDRKDAEYLNPVEIYAYYIGWNINNMYNGRIYLKYLLSYTSTYTEESREWIRASFERGLRKSLPPQVGGDKKLMRRFDVQLWRDEATAYAISALTRYLEEDYHVNGEDSLFIEELKKKRIFYGIYDFGGGTLDFSFGIMEDAKTKDVYRQLKYGGSSNLGCENLLEILAFHIFCKEGNRSRIQAKKIKCEKPFLYGIQQNEYLIVGHSNAARFNTNSMISYLRSFWIHGKKEEGLLLQSEEGKIYDAMIVDDEKEDTEQDEKYFKLKMSSKEIEEFFQEQVVKGVRLFIQYYNEVLIDHTEYKDKKFFLFLAGNASRANRVQECFQKELEKEALMERFIIKPPLPTESDRIQYQKYPGRSIPTAKSGVVYGTLLSRPGAGDIEVIDEMPKVNFLYHIGTRERSRGVAKGLFHLLMHANEVPASGSDFKKLMPISDEVFDILYTSDSKYALKQSQPIDNEVNVMTIQVPKHCIGWYLYVRAAGSSQALELHAMEDEKNDKNNKNNKNNKHNKIEALGICDLAKSEFLAADEPVTDADLEYEVCITDSKGAGYVQKIKKDDEIEPELIFETDTDTLRFFCRTVDVAGSAQEAGLDGTAAISIAVGDMGISKKIYFLKVGSDGLKVGLVCEINGNGTVYKIDLVEKTVEYI